MTDGTGKDHAMRLADVRAAMAAKKLDGYIVPRGDEYLGEYVPPGAERLAWLTGFTGSAGMAAVLADKALVLSDGRYALQLKQQTDPALFEARLISETTLAGWIALHAAAGSRIGYDPKVMTGELVNKIAAVLKDKNITLEPVEGNLVDAAGTGRPAAPASMVEAFSEAIAGVSAAGKRQNAVLSVGESRKGGPWRAMVLNAPESIAWLLNIRGSDVPHNPFALSTAILHEDGALDWYIDKARIPPAVAAALGNKVQIVPPGTLGQGLDALAGAAKAAGRPVLLDDGGTPVWFRQRLEKAGAKVEHEKDPCVFPRACKTPEEQAAIRSAHVRDGVAIVKFLKWLDDEAPKGGLTELDVVDRLQAFRALDKGLRDTSFDTIAGWAANGAIVHYRATPETNKKIVPPGLLLVDSGAQYAEGTTDITRTVAVGEPTQDMRTHNTLVLKGHIAIATAKFPDGAKGQTIDVLARMPLWKAGLDYAHGTGHGVGCFLSVHEGGTGISSAAINDFKPGMLVSNEPGYYREGQYGIRIENLVLVQEDGTVEDGRSRKRYSFETVTLAPFDRRLIDVSMLDKSEADWADAYHARVFKTIGPFLDKAEQEWLRAACAPLDRKAAPVAKPGEHRPG